MQSTVKMRAIKAEREDKLVYLPITNDPKSAPYVKPAMPNPNSITGFSVDENDEAKIQNTKDQKIINNRERAMEFVAANFGNKSKRVVEESAVRELDKVLIAAARRPAMINPRLIGVSCSITNLGRISSPRDSPSASNDAP